MRARALRLRGDAQIFNVCLRSRPAKLPIHPPDVLKSFSVDCERIKEQGEFGSTGQVPVFSIASYCNQVGLEVVLEGPLEILRGV